MPPSALSEGEVTSRSAPTVGGAGLGPRGRGRGDCHPFPQQLLSLSQAGHVPPGARTREGVPRWKRQLTGPPSHPAAAGEQTAPPPAKPFRSLLRSKSAHPRAPGPGSAVLPADGACGHSSRADVRGPSDPPAPLAHVKANVPSRVRKPETRRGGLPCSACTWSRKEAPRASEATPTPRRAQRGSAGECGDRDLNALKSFSCPILSVTRCFGAIRQFLVGGASLAVRARRARPGGGAGTGEQHGLHAGLRHPEGRRPGPSGFRVLGRPAVTHGEREKRRKKGEKR